MTEEVPAPTSIKVDRPARQVVIVWQDGVRCAYPFDFLRDNCPSAPSRAARQEMKDRPPDEFAVLDRAPSHELTDARLVGNYAINFHWADGHHAGIYTWILLRQWMDDPAVQCDAIA